MFESEMVEDEMGKISVEDTQPAILKQLLQYLYTSKVEEHFTDYKELMVLAIKYELVELVDFASYKILQGLNKENALELGIFGEIHNSPVLLNGSAKLILNNTDGSLTDGRELEKYPELMKAIIDSLFESGSNDHDVVDNVDSRKHKLEQDMLSLLESGDNGNIVLQCKGEEIKAHRNILSARSMSIEHYNQPFLIGILLRSPVFRAMLERDQPGQISEEDTEPTTLRQLLQYLYIGKVDKDFSDYKELIVIANKYGLVELVDFTSLKLLGNLNKDNAMELGIFGEIQNSTVLINGSANFFLKTMSIPDVLRQDVKKYPKLILAIILAARQKLQEPSKCKLIG